jgi:hypothetical protein
MQQKLIHKIPISTMIVRHLILSLVKSLCDYKSPQSITGRAELRESSL